MKKLLLVAIVLGLLMVSTTVLAENRFRLSVNTDVWKNPEPKWVQELRLNGTWSVEEATPQNLRGDAIARNRIYNPLPLPLQSPDGYWYVGNGSSESINPVIEKYKYIGSGGGWNYRHRNDKRRSSRFN